MKATLRMRNYLKFPLVKVTVKKIAYKSLKNIKICGSCRKIRRWKINFCDLTVSEMSQTCPNWSITSKKTIKNTFRTSKSDIRVALKKFHEPQSAALGAGGRSLLDFRFYYVALSYLVVKCLHIFLHTLFTEHLTTRIITYEIQGTELYLINVNQFTQFFLIYITSFIYSVLAPSTSSVPLATTEFRIGRRAEILHLCWQLVFDAPVAEFPTLLFTLTTPTHHFEYMLLDL